MSAAPPVGVLLVDDVDENLVALEAILEPLGQRLVKARSGEEALRAILREDFACILLDVQMPGLDGFETAELIKQRERSRHIPIIFLTAISKEERHVFRGYSAGAVDYLFKPFEPEMLRSKVSVFIELHLKTEELRRQAELLREQELAAERRISEERYRQLADAMPQIVWTADREGRATYYNRRWYEYTGQSAEQANESGWTLAVHPDDLPRTVAKRTETLESGAVFEVEYRFRAADGTYRWHLGRAVPLAGADGEIDFWIGTATDIHDHKRTQQAQEFLIEAGALLGRSLDYIDTLEAVAKAAVPAIADWCAVHVVEGGVLRQLALAHVDEQKLVFAEELQRRYPPNEQGPAADVIRSGEAQLVPELTDELLRSVAQDELHLDLMRELGLHSYLGVPLVAHERVFGSITLATAESGRRYDETDLLFAQELGRRAAMAIENARLYHEAEERAQAARVLQAVGDGVVLIDREGIVRLWNPAAARITGLDSNEVVGRPIAEIVPGWDALALRIPVAEDPGVARAETTPVEIGGRELWVSGSGVALEEGTVYAFRDLTEERALEQMRSDFVATVSHELRTPIAAIYGAALTFQRPDLARESDLRGHLLQVITDESARLASIIEDLLLASHLDSGKLHLAIVECDVRELTAAVVSAAETHLPANVTLALGVDGDVPLVRADPNQLRQVIANLLDNAVKYSPDGGEVHIGVSASGGSVRLSVADTGLGIPAIEQRRIFEKFYRLDPNMTRGIGGTGLGLYISSELVRRFDGRIWVESQEGEGSTFHVELPVATGTARRHAATVSS
ncbi:MAG TPA: PAS domain S-box protein [Gaiellaceae bacterium]|nr:PAS domain S-box protein [Gaiellaceae bacterium]